ncbi:MAG: four helix bundle protein [Phycisphaeraceae bacterium]
MAYQSYRDLVAWQKARQWVREVYQVSRRLPADERFGLTSQLRRAAVSVPANIAEGQARSGPREFGHHVSVALGSLAEVETLLILAGDLQYLRPEDIQTPLSHAQEIGRILNGLLQSLQRAGAARS